MFLTPTPPATSRLETLSGFQLLQASVGVQCTNELLKSMYNMVQKQNSQEVEEMLFHMEENLHNMNPKGNMVQETTSMRSLTIAFESSAS